MMGYSRVEDFMWNSDIGTPGLSIMEKHTVQRAQFLKWHWSIWGCLRGALLYFWEQGEMVASGFSGLGACCSYAGPRLGLLNWARPGQRHNKQ